MLAHIIVFIVSFIIGFFGFLWLLRPIIIGFRFKTQEGLLLHLFNCLICIAIMVGYVLLIYFKFNDTLWTCLGTYVSSMIFVIIPCVKERNLIIAERMNKYKETDN